MILTQEEKDVEKNFELGKGLLIHRIRTKEHANISKQRNMEKINDAIEHMKKVISMNRDNWVAMFFLGKAYQALEEHELALSWLSQAFAYESDNITICKEAGIEAIECGKFDMAVRFFKAAISLDKEDLDLYFNMALALLFSGKLDDAMLISSYMRGENSENKTYKRLVRIIRDVVDKKVGLPKSMNDVNGILNSFGGKR